MTQMYSLCSGTSCKQTIINEPLYAKTEILTFKAPSESATDSILFYWVDCLQSSHSIQAPNFLKVVVHVITLDQ